MKRLGVIGYPIKHSISPQMHTAAIDLLGLDFTYESFEVKPEDLEKFIGRIKSNEIHGINVTIPHKENIIQYLDKVDDFAKKIGAVNTVVNKNGKLVGYNTDYQGFLDSLLIDVGFDPKGRSAAVLGCGGASRAVCGGLCAAGISKLTIYDSVESKSKELFNHLKKNFKTDIKISQDLKQDILDSDLLVNTTPVGMFPNIQNSPIPADFIQENVIVFDVIYNPAETKLLKDAKAAGSKTVNGLNMFVRQGALSFKIFTGQDAPIEIMRKAVQDSLKK